MEKIKLMIIEDSVTMRNFLFQAFASDQEIEIISYASNGKLAIPRIKFYQPDIIILDYEMPLMNGIETIREIKKLNVPSKIIMFSAHTQEGATVTLQALKEGAVDFVPKPNLSISNQNQLVDYIKNELIPKVKEIAYGNKIIQKRQEIPPIEKKIVEKTAIHQIQVAGIGISTGGPILLYEMFRKLSRIKKNLFIVQHMPPLFTAKLAETLNEISVNPVVEAKDGEEVKEGYVYVAAGGYHLRVVSINNKKFIKLGDDPPKNNCKPSVDYLFESLLEAYGKNVLAIIMTGMGSDGYEGIKKVYEMGGYTISQSPETCTIYGMPKKPIEENLVREILTPEEIIKRLEEALN
jgi:two-component system chemotaxis response regulator CheB